MPLRSPLYSQRSLVLTLVVLLSTGFLATSCFSYYASRASIRDNIANTELPMTVSIGLTTLQPDDTLHSLLSRADHAMHRAKQCGRNRTCVEKSHSVHEPA
ncbi:GGDEF domain-containing protein [Pseudomonas sp. PDM26]|uniref:GGDEF domain-containing protein n=1 Tax=Pseudomonas sp. PDM26 TaxID=2854766 RepID=UPI0035287514